MTLYLVCLEFVLESKKRNSFQGVLSKISELLSHHFENILDRLDFRDSKVLGVWCKIKNKIY